MLDDHLVRMAAFQHLGHLQDVHGDLLPWSALTAGFSYDGQTIPLIGAAGIWKPQALEVPISITTSPKNPYGDSIGSDGLLEYRHQGSAARSYDNDGLRRAMREARPLIYFHGLEKGWYSALFPAVIAAKVIYGAKPMIPFKAAPGAETAPTVDFDSAPAVTTGPAVNDNTAEPAAKPAAGAN